MSTSDDNIPPASTDTTTTTNPDQQQAECSDDSVMSLKELLAQEDKLTEDAAAVLGASSDKTCSYTDGYVKRQALYSCLTCIPETKSDPENKGAGICLACCFHCHDGHELIELYTKRQFRCDCGNTKFGDTFKCNLIEAKSPVNESNCYNQNFAGLYCVCHRPYPDAEDPLPDEMIQCIVCEDWYHTRHLGAAVPAHQSFAEMICGSCMVVHEFLLHYVEDVGTNDESSDDVVVDDDLKKTATTEQGDVCRKPVDVKRKVASGAQFWSDISWRRNLCTCSACIELYRIEKVEFLVDAQDSVQVYEEQGRIRTKEILDDQDKDLAKSLNSMNRVGLVEFIHGYNDLKDGLGEFFKKFAESKKIMRVEDVQEFFEGMKAKKRQKLDNVPPAFCR